MPDLLVKGANIALPADLTDLQVGLSWEAPAVGYDLDAWTFCLDEHGRVRSDEYFIFFNSPRSPCGSVSVGEDSRTGGSEVDDEVVSVRLPDVPATVARIVFVANIHDGRRRGQSFGALDNAAIRLMDGHGREVTRYNLGEQDAGPETSLIFGELYRRDGAWRFRAIAQGSEDGPADLARGYGVDIEADPDAEPPTVTEQAPPPAPPVDLVKGRVELTKPGARARMTKTPAMEFSLYWTDHEKDLGLILHVAYTDGRSAYIDWRRLADDKGALTHHGDATKGGREVREHATVRFAADPALAAVAVIGYSELSNGTGSFRSMGAHAVLDDGAGNQVVVDLDKGGGFSYHAVIAVATVNADGSLTVERASRFSAASSERRPEVDRTGRLSMNTGPEVFKDFDLDDFDLDDLGAEDPDDAPGPAQAPGDAQRRSWFGRRKS